MLIGKLLSSIPERLASTTTADVPVETSEEGVGEGSLHNCTHGHSGVATGATISDYDQRRLKNSVVMHNFIDVMYC